MSKEQYFVSLKTKGLISRSCHVESGIKIMSLLDLTRCPFPTVTLDLQRLNFLSQIKPETLRVPLGSVNSFKSTRSYSLEIMACCAKRNLQFGFHPLFILQANHKCPSSVIICLDSSAQRK